MNIYRLSNWTYADFIIQFGKIILKHLRKICNTFITCLLYTSDAADE